MFRVFYEVPPDKYPHLEKRAGWSTQGKEFGTRIAAKSYSQKQEESFPGIIYIVVDMDEVAQELC